MPGLPAKNGAPLFQQHAATDCKSFYDAVRQPAPTLEEKRRTIDAVSIRDSTLKGHLLQAPTHAQLADALAKMDRSLSQRLRDLVVNASVTLRDCEG